MLPQKNADSAWVLLHGVVFLSVLSFTGKEEGGGRVHVTLCDYIMPWEALSAAQKKGLSQRYQMGCECKVSTPRACVCV